MLPLNLFCCVYPKSIQVGQAKHKEMTRLRTELSESVLKPTCIRGPKVQQRGLEISHDQQDTTVFDESIFGPIQKQKSQAGLEAGALPSLKAYQQTVNKKSSKSSAFELMMKCFERDKQRGRESDCDEREGRRREKKPNAEEGTKVPALKNTEWKNFINGMNTKPVCCHNQSFSVVV